MIERYYYAIVAFLPHNSTEYVPRVLRGAGGTGQCVESDGAFEWVELQGSISSHQSMLSEKAFNNIAESIES